MKSCIDCEFASKCSKARETAFNIVFKVKRLQQGLMFIEAAASHCEAYNGKKIKKIAQKQFEFNFT